jgi:polysaccharide biosynthesis/export protein
MLLANFIFMRRMTSPACYFCPLAVLFLFALCGATRVQAQAVDAAVNAEQLVAPVTNLRPAPAGQEPQVSSNSTLPLGAGDLLEIVVFDTPELSGKRRVDENGEITLPIGGMISVKGLTAPQVRSAIEERLRSRNILRDPHVDVLVDDVTTQGVTVAGEVKSPGIYPWSGKHTVLDFISAAGGVTASASRTVTISRKDREQVVTFQLGDPAQMPGGGDVEARPGDRISVARAGVVYVVGDVGRPGGYLIENRETITVLQALALAQGINKTAKYDAKLIRTTPAGRAETALSLKKILANAAADPKLQDGDILFVPVSGAKQFADKGVSSILQMAVGVVIYGRL